jgi:hypothetical protein
MDLAGRVRVIDRFEWQKNIVSLIFDCRFLYP